MNEVFRWIGFYTITMPVFITGAIVASCFIANLYDKGNRKIATLILLYAVMVILLTICCGCAWQGQRDQAWTLKVKQGFASIEYAAAYNDMQNALENVGLVIDPNGYVTMHNAEWWSMRFLWMSNGVECYTETPYYRSGAMVDQSKTDPNAVKAVVDGTVSGAKRL